MKKILFLLLIILIQAAHAQTADFVELTPTPYLKKELTASAGLGIMSLPQYIDGSQRAIAPLPWLDLQWKSGVFFSTISGFGYDFATHSSWQYGPRLGLLAHQEQSSKNHDEGPGNTPTNLAPGVFANYLIDDHFAVLTSLTAGAGIGNHHAGFLAHIGGRYINQINDQHRLFAILGTTWANSHYMQDYYGIAPEQSPRYHFPIYRANEGMQKVKLSLGWNWDLNDHWSIITGGSVTRPFGAARSSPLVSDRNQVMLYSAGYYRF